MPKPCKTPLLVVFGALSVSPAWAEVPGLPAGGQQAFADYQKAPTHRAFAIAPGGAWAWRAQADSPDLAEDGALADCAAQTRQKCVLYASNERMVFDARHWPELWGPYADAAKARRAASGTGLGQRFPDLAWRSAQGRTVRVGDLKGKVAVLHFWGSWCPPCRREMPELAQLHKALAGQPDVAFAFLQVRESYAASTQWARQQKLELPLSDSGSRGDSDADLHLADGSALPDRHIANSFPTTYVLDKHGLVVFSHVGPVADWMQYAAFLRDAARRSGK